MKYNSLNLLTLDRVKIIPVVIFADVGELRFITKIDGTGEFFRTLGFKRAVVHVETDI